MNGYDFTERVRKCLAIAREQAASLDHEYVGTEHMLLGVIAEGDGVAIEVMKGLSVDPAQLRERILGTLARGRTTTGPDLPYTSRAKKVLELAMSHARALHHSYVGTEHLLLGLIAEGRGIAAQVLTEAGVTLERALAEVVRILGTEMAGLDTAEMHPEPSEIFIEVRYPGGSMKSLRCRTRQDAIRYLRIV